MSATISVAKAPIHTKIHLRGSKSVTQRALLIAALADGVSEISNLYIDNDIRIYITALHELGIVTQLDEKTHTCIIGGSNGKFPKTQATVWCENTKSVMRYLMSACAATPGVYYFDGAMQLRNQPMSHLLNLLARQGAQIIPNDARKMPLTLVGSDSSSGGEIILDNHITSQMISALLITSPYARSPFTFTVADLANQPFIDMTCSLMAEFGVLVHRIHKGQFMVPVPQRYQANDFTIEPDFTLASYFFAAAAVTGGDLSIQATKYRQSKQPNAKFLSVLEKMGCSIHESGAGLKLKGPKALVGIDVSMRDFSDTFAVLASIATFANTPVRIAHIGNMKQSDTNRLIAMKTELTKLDIRVETGDDWIKIFPSTPKATQLSSHHDPKIAMALAIIGLKVPGITIDDTDCVETILPDFFKTWSKLSSKLNMSA